eukprot:8517309-Ditylum_brightwellii.AAC.1
MYTSIVTYLSAQSFDTNTAAPTASIPLSIDDATLPPDASVAASLLLSNPPDDPAASVYPLSSDPILSPKRREGGTSPAPTSSVNTVSSKKYELEQAFALSPKDSSFTIF